MGRVTRLSRLLKRRITTRLSMGFLTVAMGSWAAPALASFEVCNQTFDVVNVAVGQWDFDEWETSGWWTIGPNQCADVIEDTLTARFIYVYARDVFNKSVTSGTTTMCLSPDEFRIRGHEDCIIRGYLSAPFFEVDTRLSERWTFYLQTR